MTRAYLGAFAARVLAAMVGAVAFLLALVFVFTASSQVIAQTMTAPDITSEGPFLVDEGETAVATLTADDSDTAAGDLIWSKTGGADTGKFSLTSAGVLTFSAAKDYEAPDDSDADGTYEVTVQVSDGSDSDSADLVVTLENVVELTALTGPSTVDYEENRAVRVATYSASSEADRDGLSWSLSGEDASSFRIGEPAGVLRFDLAVVSSNLFSPQPDYDAPADVDSDGTYEVTVEVGDGVTSHSLAVEVTITDQDEAGTLTLSTTRPQFGVALTTTLTDPDGVTGTATYRWERSVGRSAWTDIVGATASSYTLTSAETGHFLRVTATYTDGHGGGKTVTARTSEVVTADLLSGLTVSTTDSAANSGHALRPSFDAGILHYSIGCAAAGETMTLTPTAGSGVRLSINGIQVTSGGSHTVDVDADSEVRVTLAGDSGAATTYFVRCLSGDLLDMTVTTASGATGVIEDLIMFGVAKEAERSIAIVDSNGAVRFHRMDANWSGGYFRAAWVSAAGAYRYAYYKAGAGKDWKILDQNLEVIASVATVAPLTDTNRHDITLLDDGNYIVMAYEPVDRDLSELTFGNFSTSQQVRDSAIQIRTPDGTPLLTWSSHDAIPFEDCTPKFPPHQNDYAHLNTLQMVDGDIIASFRGCNSVLRIDPDDASSHKVVWRLGLTNLSDEQWDGLGKGPAPLEIIGDAEGQFCGQHGTSLLPNGHLILFDNGVQCMLDPWLNTQLLPRPGGTYSRAVEYALDVDNNEAVFLRDHSLGGTRSKAGNVHGHVEALPNGDWLIGWGEGGSRRPTESVTQVDPDTGEEKFSIALLQADGGSESIRPIPLPPAALADDPVPLRAEFLDSGTSSFHAQGGPRPTVVIAFNQPVVDFENDTPSLGVQGATVDSVAPYFVTGESANAYRVTLIPDSAASISISLLAGQNCADSGICTADGGELVEAPAARTIYPAVTVSFDQTTYDAPEGGSIQIALMLSSDPERTIEIPLTFTEQGGASSADYSDVPNPTIIAGETEASFTFSPIQDTIDDDGEKVKVGFGALPPGMTASGTTEATVSITDDDASPVITTTALILVEENETAVATLAATDADRPAEDLTWRITGGADRNRFRLTADGVLTFGVAQDYEAPDDNDGDGDYEVTAEVSDGANPVEAMFTIRLKDVDELTTLTGPSTVDYEENRAVRVATYSASSEADRDGLSWSLSGADADSFRIDEPGGVLRFDLAVVSPNLFSPPPDYDAPADDDSDGTYEVTVEVEVGDGVTRHSLAVEVTITDQDEAGTLTLSTTRPQFGGALTTTLTDPDGVTGTATYQWERSVGRSAWTDIVGATASSYTLTSAETGHFLRVTATYTDGHGGGKTVTARTSEVVTADLLSGLTVSTTDSAANSGHALRPSFDAGILHYSIGCAAAGETMTLTPTAGSGVRLSINGIQVTSGGSHTVDVDADSEVRVTLAGDSGAATTYVVRCLSGDLLDMTVTTASGATGVIEDLIMFGVAKTTGEKSLAIVDASGAVRFHRMDANWSGGYFRAAWVSAAGAYRYAYYKAGAGKDWKILDQNLEVIASVATVAPLTNTNRHDITLLDDGNYVLFAYEPADRDLSGLTFGNFSTSQQVRDSALQIRTPDGTSLFDWNSYDAIPLEDCKPKFPPHQNDYAHLNTLQMVDGDIIASFRGCNSVLRIDPDDASSHKVVWRLGLTNLSDEQWDGLGKGPAPLEIIGDAEGQFCGQHGTSLLPNGHLILFDNGVQCMLDPWLDTQLLPRPGGTYSRAVEYALDVDNGEAVFLRDHSLGGTRSRTGQRHGHVEALEGGDWLVGWGGWEVGVGAQPTESVTQVDPDTGEEKFSIALLQADGSSASIRPIPLPPVALADDPVPLRAEFLDSGTSSFHAQGGPRPTVVIAFNQPVVDFENDTPSLGVQGATVDSVAPYFVTGESANAYRVTLIPDSAASISISLLAGQNCADSGICTADGGELVEAPAARTIYPAVTVSFDQTTYDAPEGGSIQIALMLSSDPERTIEIPLTFTEQGGASSADYSDVPNPTIIAGETEASFTFSPIQDTIDDDGEKVKVGFGALPPGMTASGTTEATVSITDDDASPVITTTALILVEENETAVATLAATDADRPAEDLTWRITGGADRNRFRLTADGVLTFGVAQDYEAPDDNDGDGDYEVTAEVSDGANPVEAMFTIRLKDVDDTAPELILAASPAAIVEAGGSAMVTVEITSGVTFAEDQEIALSFAGTATKGTDYTVALESLTLTAGQSSVATTVTAVQDSVDDDAETILITASHGGGTIGAEQTITIIDDDAAPAVTTCSGGMAGTYPCSNVDLMSFLALADIGGGEANDIWGWTDSSTGKEYAIMGRTNGTSFVDISDPVNPIYLGNLPPPAGEADERDIKVYADHAFIVTEANNSGMQVFDLTQLRMVASPPATFSETAHYPHFSDAHNLAINEDSGFAYAAGTNNCSGGLHMINIQTPTNPTSAGCFSGDGYTHDAQCVNYDGPDLDHQGKEICFNSNVDTLTIVDVTNKAAPVMLSRTGYSGSRITHQGWLTEDQVYFLLGDELDEKNNPNVTNTRTYMWNVSDLDDPALIGSHDSTTTAIDHNQYVKGNYTYQSNYHAGLRILDITDIANGNLTEAAFFDVYPGSDPTNTDGGTWSNYPFFDSGIVIVSVIKQGLFILRPNLVDGVKPALASAAVNGAVLTLTYGEVLDGNSTPATDAFTVTVAGSGRMVTHVSVSGRVVTLTLASAVAHGEAVTVSYSPGTNPIQDAVGNDALGLSNDPVRNDAPDTTAPTVSSLTITSNPGSDRTYAEGDEIRVTATFSETVKVRGTPRLTLRVGSWTRTASYLRGTDTAALVFGYEVAEGESDTDGVGVEADSLTGGTIRDEARNNAVLDHDGLAADSGHKVDGVKPELAATGGAVVNGTTLTLTFDEPLDGSSTPEAGDFTVAGGSQSRTVTGVRVSGSTVLLTLNAGAEHLETGILVSYTPGMKPIRDVPGNEVEAVSREPVRNDTPDTTSPEVSSVAITSNPGSDRTYAEGDEIRVTATFSETVKVRGTPRLTLRVGSWTRTASYLRGTDTAALVFGYEVAEGESDTDGVGVEADSLTGGTIRDEARNNAVLDHDGLAADSGHKVDGVKPELAATGGAVVNGTTLTLTFDEPLDGSSTPEAGDFTVAGGSQSRTVTGVRVSGSTVLLTLNAGAEHLEAGIQVSYTPGMKPIRDVPGNEVEALSRESVRNDTPDTTAPTVSSVAITSNPGSDRTYAEGDEIRVTATFSETVKVRGTPRLTLRVGSWTRTASYLRGTDTAALVFGYEVADGESDTDGVGVEADSLTGGTIRDEARNNAVLDHDGLAADSGHKVDAVRPELAATGGAVVNGTTLTLTFDEPLDGSSTPEAGDFTVAGGSQSRTVTGVRVSGSTVLLTLNAGAEHLETGILVSYTPGMKPIRDVPGNEVEAVSREPVRNDTPDTTSPEVSSVAITSNPGSDRTYAEGDEIRVTATFSETVKVRGTPRLTLRVGSWTRTASYLRGTDTAALVFGYEVADGESDTDGVGVEADSLTGGTIRDEARNNADLDHDGLAADSGHKVDAVRPELAASGGAVVNGTTLTLTFDETLDGSSTPAAGDFTVAGGSQSRTVTGVRVSGSTVLLTLNAGAEHLETGILVSYTPGMKPIRDVPGNEVEAVSREPVRNDTPDTTSPTVSSLTITSNPGSDRTYAEGDEIRVTATFSETVKVTGTPRLTLRVGSWTRTADYLRGTDTAALVFGYEVAEGESDTDGVGVEADSLTGGTIRDEARNNAVLDHGGLAADSGHKVDAVRPELAASGGVVINGTTLTLTFDKTIDGSSTPAAGDFTVAGGSQSRTVTGVRVSGSTVLLTLNAGAEHLEAGIQVSYTPGMKPIRDVPGNEVEALSRESVRNDTPDTTAPTVSSVAITSNPGSDRTYAEGDEIRVTATFSETVKVRGTPRLTLRVGSWTRTASYLRGTDTAALVFGYEVAEGESDTDGVGVEADSLTGGTIRDEARNNAVLDHDGLAADSGHKVDGVKPELAATGGAVVNGTTLTLTFDEPLDGSSTPEAGDFTVAGGSQSRTVTGVRVSGSTVLLTLNAGAEHLETGILVSYTPGMKPIRDVPGNEVEAVSREPVRNDTPDTTSPEVSSVAITSNPGSDRTYAAGDEIEVMVTFSETVEVEGTPQLRLRVGTRTRTADYLRGTDTAALVFGYEVVEGDEDSDGVSIEASRIALNRGAIKDEAENSAELAHGAVAPQAGHTVDGVRPAFVSAAVDGSSLTLTYGEALDEGSRPASGDFTVEVGGSGRSVSGISISGRVVTLTLNPAVEHGDTGIRVSYTVPTGVGANPIQDEVGNDARGLSSRSVTNTTGAPNTVPEITSPSSFDVPENQLVVRRLAARDTDAGDGVLGWEIVGGADQSEFSIASDTGELSFRDPPDFEGPGDNEYVVTVEVRSGAGVRELEAEQTFTIRVTDEREPPEVPEAPTFSGETADSLEVNWSEPDNTGPEITDYDVQYREKGTERFIDGDQQGPGRTLTLEDLEPGTVYEVQVRAKNDEGTGDWSESGEGMTVTPLTVVMASGTEPPVSGPFTVRFSFSEPVTGFSGSDIETGQDPACVDDQNNTVFCDPGIGVLETADNRVFTTTVTPWTDRVVHSYTLRLTVPGGAVRSSVGSKANEEPEHPLEVRVAPPGVEEPISSLGLTASGGNGTVRLSWNLPSDNGGSAIIRYEVRYQAVGEAWSEWEKVGAGVRGVTVENLVNGREYVFEVRAVNALGKGGAETAQAVPERRIAPPPPPPGGGGGGGGGGGLLFPPEAPAGLMAMPGEGAVRLEWGPPESDGGTPILRYEYRLKEGRGEFGEWTRIEDSAPGEVNATGYTVGELGNGTVYVFELRGVNLVGKGRVSEAVEAVMGLDRAYWSNFGAEDLQGGEASLERGPFGGGPQSLRLRFGAGLRFEESELDGDGEVTETRMGGYGYRYTSRTTGELRLDYDGGKSCELRLTFSGVGAGSYSYHRCVGVLGRQGSFRMSGLNRAPEITSAGAYEVAENTARVGRIEAVDGDDEIGGYGIAGGADGALFAVEAETGELMFREAPDYEDPSDVESAEPASGAADNEYIVVVEVRSGEGERERRGSRAIRVRVADEEEPPEITSVGPFEVVENRTRVGQLEAVDQDKQDEITEYGVAGGADGALFAVVEETGELMFREAPDYEDPSDVESAEPASGAADNEYIVVVEVRSGEGERERRGSRAIRVRVADEEEPPEITSVGPFEVVENRTRVGQLEAVDQDKQDEITEYGVAGGADGALFAVVEETGELMFREAPDYEDPSDVESAEPASGAGDNEYIVVVEVSSGEGERERKGSRAIRVRVSDEEEPPGVPGAPVVTAEGSDSLQVSWREPENRGPEITDYEVRYRESGEAGYSDGGHEGRGLEVRLSGLKEGTAYEVQVRAVNEEGMSEWSEPGEGRTDSEEPDPDDPSDFTGEDLEGRRLTLWLEGEEGSARSLELRFGEGNRFEQIESGGEQAATRAEVAASRSGAYAYEKTAPLMGTVRLDYDDGSSCEIRLSFTEAGVGAFAYDCGEGDPAEGSFRLTTGSLFVPVILSAAGRNNSFFTSELTLTNRGEQDVRLDYSYTADRGGGSGTASDVLAAGRQKVETDALTYLIGLGAPIPEEGNRIGTLRVEVRLGSEVEAVVRTTTVVPDGRAGLAYLGVAEEEGFDEAVYLCGLRQNAQDRSNVAFQNMGAPEEGAITVRTTVYSGEAADATARVLKDVTLEPGGFHQYSGLLGVLGVPAQGYVRVERVEGRAPFYAYGVINDQANSDGSFVFPVRASSLAESTGQTLPVVVETSAFTSELTVTNFSEEARTLDFQFVAEGIETTGNAVGFRMTLEAGRQEILADVVEELRRQGVAGLGSTRGFYAGPLFVAAEGGDMSGIVIGARTGSEGGGGSYSVFYNAVPYGEAFIREAWVDGLQQDQENRSNLALVNTGEVDGSPSVFHLEIYDGETGMLAETVVTKPIPARRWHQINGILGSYAPETRQGYIRIEKVSGENPFLAYGVVNDGGAPGERSGDGAYLPARE